MAGRAASSGARTVRVLPRPRLTAEKAAQQEKGSERTLAEIQVGEVQFPELVELRAHKHDAGAVPCGASETTPESTSIHQSTCQSSGGEFATVRCLRAE